MYEELDAKVLGQTARRLFIESMIGFRTSHNLGMESLEIWTSSQQYKQLSSAIDGEEEALKKQREAIESLKNAWNLRGKRLKSESERKKSE